MNHTSLKIPDRTHGLNFFAIDQTLKSILNRLQPGEAERRTKTLTDFGAWAGGPLDEEAIYTDRFGRPSLVSYNHKGDLINHVQHNPAWQKASEEIYRRGIVGLNYGDEPASFLITFVMGYLTSQSDVSLHCPATMTGAVAYVLNRFAPEPIRNVYLDELTRMDGKARSGGTWVTELHGGSDVGATTTTASPEGDHYRLNGLKWFTSNVDGGIAVATARPNGAPAGSKGLGLYLVPWRDGDGNLNPMRIRRLKDKLGTCGVPTGEVDLTGTYALEVAPPPEGFRLMIEALEFSRIHNAMAAVGLQRRAFLESLCFAANRQAFGNIITTYPMVQTEIIRILATFEADLELACEAAQSFDQAWRHAPDDTESDHRTWLRLATALAKYQTAENANRSCRSAIEIIGGNGYTYDYVTPRLLRDAQVLTVWEGPANIQALEILRLLGGSYSGFELFTKRIRKSLDNAPEALTGSAGALEAALKRCEDGAAFIQTEPKAAGRY
ncbi:MAG: acyl-CoA dehydrogenase family protein, partial [Methyloligellaceae bacterium]